jgi:hypothetical protein
VNADYGGATSVKESLFPKEQGEKVVGILEINHCGEPLLFVSDAREWLIYLSGNQRLTVPS